MRGRKPQPTTLKVLRGNPGRRPLNPEEPIVDALDLAVPPELHGDACAQAEWTRTIAPAIQRGQVTAGDRAIAIAHCAIWSLWQAQHAQVKPEAPRTLKLLVSVDVELGLTPSSRSRVKVSTPEKAAPSKWSGFKLA